MITLNTPLRDLLDLVESKAECSMGPDWMRIVMSQNPEILCGEAIGDLYLNDSNADPIMSLWTLEAIGEELEPDLRIFLLQKLVDPIRAYKVFLRYPYLTEAEQVILKEKYEGKV